MEDKQYYVIKYASYSKNVKSKDFKENYSEIVCVNDNWFESLGYANYLLWRFLDEEYGGFYGSERENKNAKIIEEGSNCSDEGVFVYFAKVKDKINNSIEQYCISVCRTVSLHKELDTYIAKYLSSKAKTTNE